MSYKIHVRDKCPSAPIIVCDHCGKFIRDAKDGNAMWLQTVVGDTPHQQCEVKHTHKLCCFEFESANPPGPSAWWVSNDIHHYLYRLLLNCGYDANRGRLITDLLDGKEQT